MPRARHGRPADDLLDARDLRSRSSRSVGSPLGDAVAGSARPRRRRSRSPGCATSCSRPRCASGIRVVTLWDTLLARPGHAAAGARSRCSRDSPPRSVGSSRRWQAAARSRPASRCCARASEGREMYPGDRRPARGLGRDARWAAWCWAASRAATCSARSASTRASTRRSSPWSSARTSCASPQRELRATRPPLTAHRCGPVPEPLAHHGRARGHDDHASASAERALESATASVCWPPMSYTLSEHESKQLLREAPAFPCPRSALVESADAAVRAAADARLPGRAEALRAQDRAQDRARAGAARAFGDAAAVRAAADALLAARRADDGDAQRARLPHGRRTARADRRARARSAVRAVRDARLGGIFAEAVGDVAFAVAPLAKRRRRGPDRRAAATRSCSARSAASPRSTGGKLARVLEALGRLGAERPDIRSIDVNPLIVAGDTPVVIDALVELEGDAR